MSIKTDKSVGELNHVFIFSKKFLRQTYEKVCFLKLTKEDKKCFQ